MTDAPRDRSERAEHAALASHPVAVPYARLAPDVLRRVVEEFATRDGTDYGAVEKTLDEKVADVQRRLERGEATIVYDAESETINVVETPARPALHALRARQGLRADRVPSAPNRPDPNQHSLERATDVASGKSSYSRTEPTSADLARTPFNRRS